MTIEQYKELMAQLDAVQRRGGTDDEEDAIVEQLHDPWYGFTDAERAELRAYSVHLHNLWTPRERYEEAVGILDRVFSKSPHPSDKTDPEKVAERKAYWERKRDAALAEMKERGDDV